MNIISHILNASGKLTSHIKIIEFNFNKAIKKVTERLPISNVDVIIAENPVGAIPKLGIGGRSLNANLVFISIDSNFPNLTKSLNDGLERTLAHELHHCIRWSNVGYGDTLLEALISEGLADHFDIEVNNKNPEPWSIALSEEKTKELLEKAKPEFNNKKYNHQAWFFGRGVTDIPKWTGYSLGFYLVGEYLKKNADKKPSQLYATKAEEFIK